MLSVRMAQRNLPDSAYMAGGAFDTLGGAAVGAKNHAKRVCFGDGGGAWLQSGCDLVQPSFAPRCRKPPTSASLTSAGPNRYGATTTCGVCANKDPSPNWP